MPEDPFAALYEEVGRVVIPAAQLEQALATLAYAVLGGDEAAHEKTHALQTSQLKSLIENAAADRSGEWWTDPANDLLKRSQGPLAARHGVVHGYWTDMQGLVEGGSFVAFKPDRKSRSWEARQFEISQLQRLAAELRVLSEEARELADRLVDEVHRR